VGQKSKVTIALGLLGTIAAGVLPAAVVPSVLTFIGGLGSAFILSQATSDVMTKGATSSVSKGPGK